MRNSNRFHKLFLFSSRPCCLLLWLPMYNLMLCHAQEADCKWSDNDAFPAENAALLQTKSIVAHGNPDGLKIWENHSHDNALIKPSITSENVHGQDNALIKPSITSENVHGQWQVLVYTPILLLLLSVSLIEQVYRPGQRPISMAALSCMFFGMDNFLIAYAGAYLRVPNAHMAMMFLFIGVIAIVVHVPMVLLSRAYKAQFGEMLSSSKFMLVCIAFTSILVDGAEVCSNTGFSMSVTQSGPFQALASCNVLIVCPFFYYFYGEKLTALQLCGMILLVAGATFLADVAQWSTNSISLYAFMWIMFSMILYSASDITLRVSSVVGLAWQPRVMFMLLVMGFMGFPMYFIDREANAFIEYYEKPTLLVWPFLNAIAGILGLLSCTIAFEAPDAPCGILSAIVNANSAVLVILNKAILGYSPSLSKIVGFSFIMIGVALFHLTYSAQSTEGEKEGYAESGVKTPKSVESGVQTPKSCQSCFEGSLPH